MGIGKLSIVDDRLKVLSALQKSLGDGSDSRAGAFKNSSDQDTAIIFKKRNLADADLESILAQHDIVIDSLLSWQEKLLLSDMCMSLNKPMIHSGITGFRYQLFCMLPGKSACLRCALPLAGIDDIPLQPSEAKTIDAILAIVGAWQAIETMKLIAHVGATQGNELLKFDCLSGECEIIRGLDRQLDCPDCGKKQTRRRSR
jgi:adenylyltransferase/sulfurtransferase